MSEPLCFMAYWDAVDDALRRMFGVDTFDTGTEPDAIAAAEEAAMSPEDFARCIGEKYDLTPINETGWR